MSYSIAIDDSNSELVTGFCHVKSAISLRLQNDSSNNRQAVLSFNLLMSLIKHKLQDSRQKTFRNGCKSEIIQKCTCSGVIGNQKSEITQ